MIIIITTTNTIAINTAITTANSNNDNSSNNNNNDKYNKMELNVYYDPDITDSTLYKKAYIILSALNGLPIFIMVVRTELKIKQLLSNKVT